MFDLPIKDASALLAEPVPSPTVNRGVVYLGAGAKLKVRLSDGTVVEQDAGVSGFDYAGMAHELDPTIQDAGGTLTTGMRFLALDDAVVRGVAVYWPCSASTDMQLSLWDVTTGVELATITENVAAGEVLRGLFAVPVPVQAFRQYVVSARDTSEQRYAASPNLNLPLPILPSIIGRVMYIAGMYIKGPGMPDQQDAWFPVCPVF